MTSRPEWVSCVKNASSKGDNPVSWCGRKIGAEFHLTGLDHAAALQTSRLQSCPDCVLNAIMALKEGIFE